MTKVWKKRGLRITVDRALGERLSERVWRKLNRIILADGGIRGQAPQGAPSSKKKFKHQRKPAQEKILRKLREKYPPDGDVGDASTAEVRRAISGKGYDPSWDSVNRTLGRDRKK